MQTKLDRFLLTYRATPTTLGKSPSELLMNRQPRIRFSALRAKSSKQEVKVFQDNLDTKLQFTPNQAVFVRNFGKGAKWIPGTIVGTVSPRNFEVQVGDIIWKRHQEQLRPQFIPSTLGSELVRAPQLPEQTEGLTPVVRERPVTTPTFHSLKRLHLYLTLQPWIAWLMLFLHRRTHLCEIQSFKHQRLSNQNGDTLSESVNRLRGSTSL